MKIFKIAMISLCMVTLISTAAFAAGAASNGTAVTDAGSPMTVASTTGNDDFVFTPSPSTLIAIFTSAREFAMTTTSAKTTTDNGLIYGVLSSASPIYQMDQAADGVNIPPAAADALPSADFEDKAGNAAS